MLCSTQVTGHNSQQSSFVYTQVWLELPDISVKFWSCTLDLNGQSHSSTIEKPFLVKENSHNLWSSSETVWTKLLQIDSYHGHSWTYIRSNIVSLVLFSWIDGYVKRKWWVHTFKCGPIFSLLMAFLTISLETALMS